MKMVIFAGGVGTRLWPLSRKRSPKQFERIIGNNSTLQLAAKRLQPDFAWEDIYISTGKNYVDIVKLQLPNIPQENIIGEPEMRDVGPAVGLVTSLLVKKFPHEPMGILWSDHLVRKEALFRKILHTAGKLVEHDPEKIIFVSQKPRFASENLGWMEFGEREKILNGIVFHRLIDFQYRPDARTAKKYLESGHHAWNLGYFVTTPRFLWEQYKRFAPNLYNGISKITDSTTAHMYNTRLLSIYPTLEKISFDNAILEKLDTKNGLVVSDNIEWSDIGAWEALKEALQDADNKNVTQGKVILNDTIDSLVYNYTEQTVVTIDIEDMLVVSTPDVVMVCRKSSVPKIKKLVESLSNTEHDHLT